MQVYVAGKTGDEERVRTVMECVRGAGCQITYDWTNHADERGLLPDVLIDAAYKCERAVISSELFVLVDHPNLVGGLVEFGMAAQLRIPTLILQDPHHAAQGYRSIFFYLAHVIVVSDLDELVSYL